VATFIQIIFTPFKDKLFGNSWWFKCYHPKFNIQLAKGLEIYKAQVLTS
jgi:hypothetical protein